MGGDDRLARLRDIEVREAKLHDEFRDVQQRIRTAPSEEKRRSHRARGYQILIELRGLRIERDDVHEWADEGDRVGIRWQES